MSRPKQLETNLNVLDVALHSRQLQIEMARKLKLKSNNSVYLKDAKKRISSEQ